MSPPIPENEVRRLASLRSYLILDTAPEDLFDDITKLAAQICKTPMALITLVDEERQWCKSQFDISLKETPREESFCAHAVAAEDYLEVHDTHNDPRFAENPLVLGWPHIRFYAGMPLVTPDGYSLGALCVIDSVPSTLNAIQKEALGMLSKQVVQLLEMRLLNERLQDTLKRSESKRVELYQAHVELRNVMSNVTETYALFNLKGEVVSFNENAERFVVNNYGTQIKEGMRMEDFLPPDRCILHHQHMALAVDGDTVDIEPEVLTYHNKDYWFRMRYAPAFDLHGKVVGITLTKRDVTKQMEALEGNKRKDLMLSDIAQFQSHNLRGPLSRIVGLARLMDDTDMNADNKLLIKYLKVACKELDEVVHTIVGSSVKAIG